ncbi:MAG: glycosyltransferase family 9 protein [Candidatus Sericytochromatia bacterium]|nr:glycosyltransferase family 9 protein [Candidatus Sericytochromatia bacterium]
MAFNPAVDDVYTFDAKHNPRVRDFFTLVLALRKECFELVITAGSSPVMALLARLTGAPHRVGYATHRFTFLLTHAVPLNKQQYAAHMYHDLVGFLGKAPRPPQMTVPPSDRAWAEKFLESSQQQEKTQTVVIHPGVSKLSIQKNIIKGWALENWIELARRLCASGKRVVLAGGPDDKEVIAALRSQLNTQVIDASTATETLGQLAALIEAADVLVAVDSAPMHVGVAVSTPTVAVFGPTDPRKLLPSGSVHRPVQSGPLACRPCLWDKRQTSCEALTCLIEIPVEAVEDALLKVLPPVVDGVQ